LEKFYEHLKLNGPVYNPHSYSTQLKFLQSRFRQECELYTSLKDNPSSKNYIFDRTIFEFWSVFALSHYKSGLMNREEYENYMGVFSKLLPRIQLPDLLIYLKLDAKKLHERIKSRGREMEKDISPEYLQSLEDLYGNFVKQFRDLGVEVVEINTETKDEYPKVIERIRKLRTEQVKEDSLSIEFEQIIPNHAIQH
jgi:deoxyadenosine/deoxycytidine kinase